MLVSIFLSNHHSLNYTIPSKLILGLPLQRNPCNGPEVYVDHLGKDPDHDKNSQLWIHNCLVKHHNEIIQHTGMVKSAMFGDKHLNLEMQWVSASSFYLSHMFGVVDCN